MHHVPSFSWQQWNKCNDSEDPAENSKVKKGECWDASNPVPLLLPFPGGSPHYLSAKINALFTFFPVKKRPSLNGDMKKITCFRLYWAKFFPSSLWNKDRRVTPGPENKHENTASNFCSRLIQQMFLWCLLVGPFNSRRQVRWVHAWCYLCMTVGEIDGCVSLPAAQSQRWGKRTILHWQCYLLMGPNLPLDITLCHSGAGTASIID